MNEIRFDEDKNVFILKIQGLFSLDDMAEFIVALSFYFNSCRIHKHFKDIAEKHEAIEAVEAILKEARNGV